VLSTLLTRWWGAHWPSTYATEQASRSRSEGCRSELLSTVRVYPPHGGRYAPAHASPRVN